MISQHPSGLAVVAAPNRPAEMRSFDPDVVTRLLDLVSSHFDYVVFDMPRTWFSWTDSVLLGSNKLFIVSETTVPGLRHAKQLVDADPRAARRRAETAGHHQSLRAETVLAPACAAATSSRRSATPFPPACRTTTGWCARPSTAAFRLKRSGRATRSRFSSRNWSCRKATAKPTKEAAGAGEEIQAVVGAIVGTVVARNSTTCSGRSAARSGALQNRDLRRRRVWDDPGSAVHRFALHRIRETYALAL